MSKDPKFLETRKLMVYGEVFTKMSESLQEFGEGVYTNHKAGGIDDDNKDKLLTQISKQMDLVEQKRIAIVKEITKRVKKDTGINRGPGDLNVWFSKILDEFPVLTKSAEEIALEKKKAEKKEKKNPKKEPLKKVEDK